MPPRRFDEVERPAGVGVEVIERNNRRTIMRRLRGTVDDDVWLDLTDQIEHTLTVTDIELVMTEIAEAGFEPVLVPPGVALWPEKTAR